jgi:hypothetical protein
MISNDHGSSSGIFGADEFLRTTGQLPPRLQEPPLSLGSEGSQPSRFSSKAIVEE